MARSKNPEKSRKDTEKSLLSSMRERGLKSKYYTDQIVQYMEFYDYLNVLNDILSDIKARIMCGENAGEEFKKMTSEKRMIVNSMQNILTFLGLKPDFTKPPSDEETAL